MLQEYSPAPTSVNSWKPPAFTPPPPPNPRRCSLRYGLFIIDLIRSHCSRRRLPAPHASALQNLDFSLHVSPGTFYGGSAQLVTEQEEFNNVPLDALARSWPSGLF